MDIEIRNVTRFSYGEMTDGAYVMWAQGKAGWFEIRPAEHYKPIFDDMVRAVELLYFVSDIYNEPRKRGGGPSAQLIFQEVSVQRPGTGLDKRDGSYNACFATSVLTRDSMPKMNASLAETQQLRGSSFTSIIHSSSCAS